MWDLLQWESFQYFLPKVNPANGLIADKNEEWLASQHCGRRSCPVDLPVAVERDFLSRGDAIADARGSAFFPKQPSGA